MTQSGPSLDLLKKHRSILLACETIGWLHMTGKANPNFLRKHGGQKNDYNPKKWTEALTVDWDSTLSWLSKHDVVTWPTSLSDFLGQFDCGGAKDMVGLLQAAHAMASGIEKQSYPENTICYLGQDTTHMWRTTAFGHPVRNLLEDPPAVLQDGGWADLLKKVSELLKALKNLGVDEVTSVDEWHRWRRNVIGHDGWLRRTFSQTLAETRLPNNDVTLWDQSYVAAALFKSAVAGALLEGSDFKWEDNKQNTRWRVLTVGVGAEHYEARAVRIGDWTGARRTIDGFFDEICKLIEVELAVGSLLYRDDEVLAFGFPGLRSQDVAEKAQDDAEKAQRKALLPELQAGVDKVGTARRLDMPPVVRLSASTRSMIRMAQEVEEARKTLRVPLHRPWKVPTNNGPNNRQNGSHTCAICGLRPNGSSGSAREKKGTPCQLCRERRDGRLQNWLEGHVEGDSIWISEVADHHDRVALLTLNLGLGDWLDGTAVDSLRAQSVCDWANENTTQKKPLPANHDELSNWLHRAMGTGNKATQARKEIQKKLAPGLNNFKWSDSNSSDSNWKKFFGHMVQDRAAAPSWVDLKGHNARAQWLAHQLFRKNASPGRVRRFWETTEAFFSELLAQFREIVSQDANRWRVRRCVVTPNDGNWTERQTYAGHWGTGDAAAPLEFVCRRDKSLVSISNLARVLGHANDLSRLQDKTIDVVDDDGERHQVEIQAVSEAPSPLGTYHPLIVLERSPARFRLLVPLAAVDACVQAAEEKWRVEFARVWDRLPLRVGVVGFPRRLPYQAVVEAARNVEEDLAELARSSPKTWRVRDVSTFGGVTKVLFVRPDGADQLVTISTTVPDGRADVFYPNCAVDQGALREPHDFAARDPKNRSHQQIYRWVPELRPGDEIRVAPAQFAQVFLDSTAGRFSPVSVRYLDDWRAMQEVWRLVCQTAPSLTAARALEALLLEKQEMWTFPADAMAADAMASDAWLSFVRASLVNLWSVRGASLDTLVDAVRRGILLETLAWHLRVLKKNTET